MTSNGFLSKIFTLQHHHLIFQPNFRILLFLNNVLRFILNSGEFPNYHKSWFNTIVLSELYFRRSVFSYRKRENETCARVKLTVVYIQFI